MTQPLGTQVGPHVGEATWQDVWPAVSSGGDKYTKETLLDQFNPTSLLREEQTCGQPDADLLPTAGAETLELRRRPAAPTTPGAGPLTTDAELQAFLAYLDELAGEPPDTVEPSAFHMGKILGPLTRAAMYEDD